MVRRSPGSNDTIAAIATCCVAPSGINIIRISGDRAESVIKGIFKSVDIEDGMEPNRMYLGRIIGDNFLERAFCVLYKAPKSYTGEDVAEIHCHGGRGVTAAVLRLVLKNGARLAEAGEFTKRAFLNGKLKLNEAEGVADMINAETEGQVRNAYKLMSGEITTGIEEAQGYIKEAIAYIEAKLDYPDEMADETDEKILPILNKAIGITDRLIASSEKTKTLKYGIDIAIIGNPNSGKSSLLNAILKEERAIVTPIAGTTRDVIKESVEYRGIKLNFLDTAGIRESDDEIEMMGVNKSYDAARSADIVIYLKDATDRDGAEPKILKGLKYIKVINKTDVADTDEDGIKISALKGINIDNLLERIATEAGLGKIDGGIITNERHVSALCECKKYLNSALNGYETTSPDCVTVDLYSAAEELGKITGSDVGEDVIEEIFTRFCVGK